MAAVWLSDMTLLSINQVAPRRVRLIQERTPRSTQPSHSSMGRCIVDIAVQRGMCMSPVRLAVALLRNNLEQVSHIPLLTASVDKQMV